MLDTERTLVGTVNLRALEAGVVAPVTRDVDLLAYTGAVVDVGWGPEVFSLPGIQTPTPKVPLLLNHDTSRIAGFSSSVTNSGKDLALKGKVFVNEPDGGSVASRSDLGFPWQASIRLQVLATEDVMAGEHEVNGRMLTGPFTLVTKSILKEVSFVALGADPSTRAVVLAGTEINKEKAMTVEVDKIREQERERVRTIMAAFPDDQNFVREHVEKGSSLEQARAAWAPVVEARLVEERKARVTVEAELAAMKKQAASVVLPRSGGGEAQPGGSAKDRFMRFVEKYETAGMTRGDAVAQVCKTKPDLHKEWLEEVNRG